MKLSVIVPVYNVEKHLVRCIESVVAQGLADYEIILVDDGSTDGSAGLCDELQRAHAEVRVVHRTNGGLSVARNTGIEAARGEYLTFVDSDDVLSPDTLGANLDYMVAHPEVDMLEYPVEVHAESKQAYDLRFEEVTVRTEIFTHWMKQEGYAHCYAWNKIYKAHLWSEMRFPVGEYYEDTAVMPAIVRRCGAIHYSDRGCYRYIMHEGTITTSYRYVRQRQLFANMHGLYGEIKYDVALRSEALRLWVACLNLLVDMGRCTDVDKVDYARWLVEVERGRPAYGELLRAAHGVSTRLKLLPLLLVGLARYCRTYVALTKPLKA